MLCSIGLGCLRLAVHPAACGRQSSEVPYRQQKRREEMEKKPKTKQTQSRGEKEVRKREKEIKLYWTERKIKGERPG